MARKVTAGPATPVHITNPEDIVVNVGDITLGAVSISGVADGVDVTQGAIADAAVTGNSAGTVSGKLRGILTNLATLISNWTTLLGRIPAALTASGNLKVSVEEGGVGGGAMTVADGADVALGATTDAAVTTDANGTVSGKLRGLVVHMVALLAKLPAALGANGGLKVEGVAGGTAVPVSGTFYQATQPVSAAALPLPTGAATDAKQDTGNGSLGTLAGAVSGTEVQVDVVASLPAGTNAIGKLAANSGVDIGDVDILSIAAGDNNIGNVDIASEIPAGTNLIGKASVAQDTSAIYNGATALTPKFAAISGATSGDNTLVAAVANKKIRVLALALVAITAVNVRFENGAAGTALSGVMSIGATGGFVLPFNPTGWFETGSNTLLNMELSAAVQVSGCLTYVEV